MADPVSLVASVIAIATAAAQISKAIARLRAFGEIPQQAYALKNEVSDLEVVLQQLGVALKQKTLTPDHNQEALEAILLRTREQLSDLAKALDKFADACAGKASGNAFDRGLLRYKGKAMFQDFQEKIRGLKESLNMMLGASNSNDLGHVKLELRRIAFLTATSRGRDDQNVALITSALKGHETVLGTRVDQRFMDLNHRLDELSRMLQEARSSRNQDQPPEYTEKKEDESSSIEVAQIFLAARSDCRNWCPCRCHSKRKVLRTPTIVESMLGRLFVGYTGLPILSNSCDFIGCRDQQQSAATVEYWFPWWFVAMNLRLQLKHIPMSGPQLQLSTTRRVPDSSLSITYAMQGNIEGLKHLFTTGMASPRDVSDSRGYSLMRWALYGGMHNYETVHFLLHAGAHVDEISYDNVWDFLMRGKCNETESQALRCITEGGDGDWFDEQNFPLVHRIVFGLSSKSLEAELEENPNAVYVTDSQGRTALAWATARMQLKDMQQLLDRGADANNMDITGRTPVLHAVDSHSPSCLELILRNGGQPNLKMPKGLFRSSPITAAGFSGQQELLQLLLKHGAEPNARNPEGLTALHAVARTKHVNCAILLLEYGADLNAPANNGDTPLTTSIKHNNHPVLQLFVDRCYDYITTLRFSGPQLLPIIAEHADIESINVLAYSHPIKLALDTSLSNMLRCRTILENRSDYYEKLSIAFEELATIAQAEESVADSIASLQESALFYSAKSSFHSELAEAFAQLNSAIGSAMNSGQNSAGRSSPIGSIAEESGDSDSPAEGESQTLKEPPLDAGIERVQW